MSGPKVSYPRIGIDRLAIATAQAKFDYNVTVCSNCASSLEGIFTQLEQRIKELDEIGDLDSSYVSEIFKVKEDIKKMENEVESIITQGKLAVQYSKAALKERERMQQQVSGFDRGYKEALRWKYGEYSKDLYFVEALNEKITRRSAGIRSKAKDSLTKLTKMQQLILDEKVYKNITKDSYYFEFENATKVFSAQEYIEKVNKAMKEVSEMHLSSKLNEKLEDIRQKASAIENGNFIHNFYQISIVPFVKECKEYNEYYELHNEEFETAKLYTQILAKQLGMTIEEYELSPEGLEYYVKKQDELSEIDIENRKLAYIKESFDEAMEELGYNLVGQKESTNKRGEQFQNHLFSYGEGTVVNVTFSNNGQVVMELGGVDEEDRLPNYEESTKLVEAMHNFCGAYERIEEKLAEKGVINERISLMPAEEDFAQIINVSEFNMNTKVQRFEATKQAVQETKYMHQGGDD